MQSTLHLGPDVDDVAPDPDITAAIEAFRPSVVEIRARSAKLIEPRLTDDQRAAEQGAIDALVADMNSRSERLGITLDELFRLINTDLASRRDGDPSRPHGPLLLALIEENGRAHGAERRAWQALDVAKARVEVAIGERIAADRACAGYVAGHDIRGQQA